MKFLYIFILTFLFTGCEFFESEDDKAKKIQIEKKAFEKEVKNSKEVQLKKLSSQTEIELAILNSKKELATIEKEKELEKIRMQAEVDKQKIIIAQENQRAIFDQKLKESEISNSMELKRYFVVILALLLVVCSFFIFYYFKKRREDKLRAYNDNLQKYFYQKENDARVKIAEKMLDTISSGKLDKSQESQLISALSGQNNGNYQNQLNPSNGVDAIDNK